MAPITNAQADQMQALEHFHGYQLADFFAAVIRLPIIFMSR